MPSWVVIARLEDVTRRGELRDVCTSLERGDAVGHRDGLGAGLHADPGGRRGAWAPERGEFPGLCQRMQQDGSRLAGLQGLHEPGGGPVIAPCRPGFLPGHWNDGTKVLAVGASHGKSRRLAVRGAVMTLPGLPRTLGMRRDG